jgi:hypothetical protein
LSAAVVGAAPETPTPAAPEKPPELTSVSGRFVQEDFAPVSGGVVYFLFQERLKEIPHEDAMAKVRAMSEVAAEVDKDGSFTLEMKPGNFAIVYDQQAKFSEEAAKPGPDSMAVVRKLTREQVDGKIAAIRENAQKGLPIADGKIGDAFIIENRLIRPPISDFGEMALSVDHSVAVIAVKEDGELVDFPVLLKLRGKNGDIYEAHTPSMASPGKFVFQDVQPQRYDVFAIGVRPKPGAGDDATTPTLENSAFESDGTPMEHKVTVIPGKPGEQEEPPPPPVPAEKK